MKKILIGIQARSGSTRLPRKAFELIGGKMMTDRVIDACQRAAAFMNREPKGWQSEVALLVPTGDPIARAFADRCRIIEGPEHDVLTRYCIAAETVAAHYIVRVTGDCPMIPPNVISAVVRIARGGDYDYLSNVDPRFRTSVDGIDCEVISQRLLREAASCATAPSDREHVTTWIRREAPAWAKVGAVIDRFDHSDQKLSVDTPEDLERVREAFGAAGEKHRKAVLAYGHSFVHWL